MTFFNLIFLKELWVHWEPFKGSVKISGVLVIGFLSTLLDKASLSTIDFQILYLYYDNKHLHAHSYVVSSIPI